MRVRSVSSSSKAARSSSPRSLIGATRSRAPASPQTICHGTMFEWCSMAEINDLVAGLQPRADEAAGHQVDALGGAAHEDDLLGVLRAHEAPRDLACPLVGLGGALGQRMDAPVNVRVVVGVGRLVSASITARGFWAEAALSR